MDLVRKKLNKGIIHSFNFLGEFFLFDTSTNSLFSIPKDYYLSISSLKECEELLTDLTCGEKEGYFLPSNQPYTDNRIFKSLCLLITRKCNFACQYCFAEDNKKVGDKNPIMSKEIAKEALDFIVKESRERKTLEIDFFGGEPLIGYETVKNAIEYSKVLSKKFDKKFLFSLTTNASMLTYEIIDYLNRENVSLILSLDGDKSTNDTFRIKRDGKGTFDNTFENVKKVTSTRVDGYYVRGTYTRKTINFPESIKFLYECGFKKISIEPVVTKSSDFSLGKDNLPLLKGNYEKLARWYVETKKMNNEFSFYHFELDLKKGACIEKLMTGCGAGVEYLSISPEGELYPCHQFDGLPEFKLGDISGGITNIPLVERFRTSTIVSKRKPCKTCWARYLCGGGCLANNYTINSDIDFCYSLGCEIQKLRLEAALYTQAKL